MAGRGIGGMERAEVRAVAAAEIVRRRADSDRTRIAWLREQVGRLRKRQPARHRLARGAAHGLLSAAAALAAYLPAEALGLREGFWSAITAVAVTQTEFGATRSTARDQLVGAVVGGAVGLGAGLAAGNAIPAYAAAVAAAILACYVLNVASAGRLAATTATIILIVPHPGPMERAAASRVFEVGWGVCVAFAAVWIATRAARRVGIDL